MKSTMKVMVVEDEDLLLKAIAEKLKRDGIEAILCKNGREALDYLQGSDNLPQAIWLDYYLTDMDGLAFMSDLKQNSLWSSIPVIVVSNSASTQKVNSMIALGANKYLLKAEYRLEDIVKIIREMV